MEGKGAVRSGGDTLGRSSGRSGTFILASATLLVLIPMLAGLRHEFYLDDFTWFEGLFKAGNSPLRILAPWKTYEIRTLGQVLFFLQYRLCGLHPFGYNLTSLVIHIGSAFLVRRLASYGGLSRNLSWWSGLLFFAGMGNYTKPVTWTCAQVILLGTFFGLCSVTSMVGFLKRRQGSPEALRSGFPVASMIFYAVALASHEIVILLFLGLAFIARVMGFQRWRWTLAVGLAEAVLYTLITLPVHRHHPVTWGTPLTPLWNLFHFPAAFLFPPQGPGALQRLLAGANLPRILFWGTEAVVYLAGLLVLLGMIVLARKSSPYLRGLMVFSLLIFLPVLPMPMPPDWIEVRYLYPISAFLAPALVAALAALLLRSGPRARTVLLAACVLWGAAIFTGSLYMQKQARILGTLPGSRERWEYIQSLKKVTRESGQPGEPNEPADTR